VARQILPALRRGASWLPTVVLLLASLATAGSPLGIWSSHIERLSHFRLWWLGVLLLLAFWFIRRRQPVPGILAVLVVGWSLMPVLPYWFAPRPAASPSAAQAPLKVIAWNVLWSNPQKAEALAWLEAQDADLILLTECTVEWREELAPLTTTWPHQISSNRDGAEGMWLLSRYPLAPADADGLAAKKPWISTLVQTPAGPVRVLGMHPRTPRSGTRFDDRNEQYEHAASIASQATSSGIPALLMGDLNCTPFSPWFSRLLERGALRDSALGFGLSGTWHGQGVRLPIDHILVNDRFSVLARRVEEDRRGSDHHPVKATLVLQARP